MDKRTTVLAKYQEGVLRPLEPLDLPEGTTVAVTIDPQALVKRFDALVEEIHQRNRHIPLEEVERDVERAIREVREERKKDGRDPGRS